MDRDIIIAFIAFQMTFLFLDIYILLKTNRDIVRQSEYTWFSALTVTHMVYLVLNSIWSLKEYDLINLSRPTLTVLYTVSLWTVTNCATSFFLFVVEKLQLKKLRTGAGKWLRQLPAAAATLLLALSPWTGLVFRLSEEGYLVRGRLYLPMVLISSLYLLAVAAIAAVRMLREHTTFMRRANGALFGSVLIIIAFIAADGMLSKASILPGAVFAVILIIFVTLQEAGINSDALTGMNNRRRAEEYLEEALATASPSNPVYLYIGDLNGFKKINDTYGHIEGDEALILCSGALKRTAAQTDGFTARYGGDEFLMVWRPGKGKQDDPGQLVQLLGGYLRECSEGKPYKLEMCVGYARCTQPREPLRACFSRADEMLYREKAAANSGR